MCFCLCLNALLHRNEATMQSVMYVMYQRWRDMLGGKGEPAIGAIMCFHLWYVICIAGAFTCLPSMKVI